MSCGDCNCLLLELSYFFLAHARLTINVTMTVAISIAIKINTDIVIATTSVDNPSDPKNIHILQLLTRVAMYHEPR